MKNTKDVTALFIDHGMFVEMAARLGRDFAKVYYYTPWESAFPTINMAKIGEGIDGIERVDSIFGDHFSEVDLFIFPDIYFADLQVYLESIGKSVWGARHGESLELDRTATKQVMKDLGLAVQPWKSLEGIDALREHLMDHSDQWVKVSKYRGTFETFKSPDYLTVEPKLDEVERNLGAFKHSTEFLVEDNLPDMVEYGTDAYCIDGKFPSKLMAGIEVKDQGYVGKFTPFASIPEPLTHFDRTIAPVLRRLGYRGFYSAEIRVGQDHTPYMIDFCARAGAPPNELWQEFYTNLADIIWHGANGELIDPVPAAKYGAEAIITSSFAEHNWQPIHFPEKIRQFVKLRNAAKVGDRYYVIPQKDGLVEVGAVIGWGNSMEVAIEEVKKHAEQVKGHDLEIATASFDDASSQIEKLKKFNLNYF